MKNSKLKTAARFLILLSLPVGQALASVYAQEGVWVIDPTHSYLRQFAAHPEYSVDHPNSQGFELYGATGLRDWLRQHNIAFREFPRYHHPQQTSDYPSFEALEKKLGEIHSNYPAITKLFSIGKSTEGRDLWVLKISNLPELDQREPQAKYISTMHGDEVTGRELMVNLIEDLCAGYSQAGLLRTLIDNTEIYIMPSMNPDGTHAHARANASGVDLNRDFPDFTAEGQPNTPDGRAPETQAVMKFETQHDFALSANFHGGSEVVNYPWDSLEALYPFDTLVRDISLNYAAKVPYLKNSAEFPGGVTNGHAWYEIKGGMQDWSTYYYSDLQVTIELSATKWPEYSEMARFYGDNKESLIEFLTTVHQGAGFRYKTNQTGQTQITRTDTAAPQDLGSFSFWNGQFYKILEPGRYHFRVTPQSNSSSEFDIDVEGNKIYPHGNYVELKSPGE